MSPPSERGLPKVVPEKQAGQHWTRIGAQHPEDNDGLEGGVSRSEAEVSMEELYFKGVIGYEKLDLTEGDV